MAYYVILRCHYYGARIGPWNLCVEEGGEPATFDSRDEAIDAIYASGLKHNQYACELKILSDHDGEEDIRIERRRNSDSQSRTEG